MISEMPPAQTGDESVAAGRESHIERGVRITGTKPQRPLIVQALLAQKLEGTEPAEVTSPAGEIHRARQYGRTDSACIVLRIRGAGSEGLVVAAQRCGEFFIRRRRSRQVAQRDAPFQHSC